MSDAASSQSLPEDEIVRLLRGEILSGRGVIAFGNSISEKAAILRVVLREAAHVAGRTTDLRHADLDPSSTAVRFHPNPFRMCLGSLGPDSARLVLSGRLKKIPSLAGWRRDEGIFDERATNPLPAFEPHAVMLRNEILFLTGSVTRIQEVGSAIVWQMRKGAKAAKSEPALVVGASLDLAPAAKLLKWECMRGVNAEPEKFGEALSVMGSPAAMKRLLLARPEAGSWESRLAGSRDVPLRRTSDGLLVAEGEGRVVVVARWTADAGAVTACADILANGWCDVGVCDRGAGHGRAVASTDERLARDAWIGGVGGLDGFAMPKGSFLPAEAGAAAFRDFVEARCDRRLMQACLSWHDPQKLHARASSGGKSQAWRRQFVHAMPALAGLLLEPGFARVVDAGMETVPAVADWFGVPVPVARRLVGRASLPCPAPCRTARETHEHSGRFLAMLGHDALPRDAAGWEAMVACARKAFNLHSSSESFKDKALEHPVRLLLGMRGEWRERARTLADVDDAEVCAAVDMIQGYQDLLNAVDAGVPGQGRDGGVYDYVGLSMMAGHGSLTRLLDASRRWHLDPVLAHSDGRVGEDATWAVPFETHDLGDGLTATCLPSAVALVAEGAVGADADGLEGLDHCVATYASSCKGGYSLILSLRRDGVRLATVELVSLMQGATSLRFGIVELWVRQCRGRRNKAPPEAATEALRRLARDLDAGRILLDPEALVRREPFGASVPVAFARERLELWRPYLPKALAGKSVEIQVAVAKAALQASPLRKGYDGRWR